MLRRASSLLPGWLPPFQVVLALFGIAVGLLPGLPHWRPSSELILAVFIPALVFEAALNLNLPALRQVIWPVALLATAGVVISIGVIGVLIHLIVGLSWPGALLLGAILSPTDPVAVVALVRRSGAPVQLATLLEGESLFNDGTGAAAFLAVLAATASGHFSVLDASLRFVALTVAGALIGAAVGLVGATVVRRISWTPLEVALTVVVAYGSYAVAAAVGAAGVMAVAAAGVAMAAIGRWGRGTERSWARLVLLLSVALFTLIGLGLPASSVLGYALPILLGFGILLASRAVPVYLLGFGIPHRWRQLMWWGGVRGAISVALALAAKGQPGVDSSVPVIAYGIVVLSLIFQGSAIRPAVSLLRLNQGPQP
ncbi:MAG TPA: sodium:proton antiporter [Candidatus Dormibacteraeota bacterium]|nr:sodium:proton antiporter [Candidatus Dormibacteraeota bacterium]